MKKVRLDLKSKNVPQKIEDGKKIVKSVTGNVNFATPLPTLASVTTAVTNLETAFNDAENARKQAQSKTVFMHQMEAVYDNLLTQLGNYVENTANGDEAKTKSAGMDVKGEAVSTMSLVAKPFNVHAAEGEKDGEVLLQWNKIDGAKSYTIDLCPDPIDAAKWTHAAVVTKTRAEIANLTSGQRYWFRVAGINTNGQSGWSDPATKIAP